MVGVRKEDSRLVLVAANSPDRCTLLVKPKEDKDIAPSIESTRANTTVKQTRYTVRVLSATSGEEHKVSVSGDMTVREMRLQLAGADAGPFVFKDTRLDDSHQLQDYDIGPQSQLLVTPSVSVQPDTVADTFPVHVHSVSNGKWHTVIVSTDSTVLDLLQQVKAGTRHLVFGGTRLEHNRRLADYGIVPQSTLKLLPSLAMKTSLAVLRARNIFVRRRRRREETPSWPPKSMKDLASHLSAGHWRARIEGRYVSRSVLVCAKAGTGKSWSINQLQYALAKQKSPFSCLPVVVRGQRLASIVANRQEELGNAAGEELIRAYIEQEYASDPRVQVMLLQSLRMHTAALLFDGVDEVSSELRRRLQNIFTDDLAAKRLRCVVTSRPYGVHSERFAKAEFLVVDLSELTTEQQKNAIHQQLENDEFFVHMFALHTLREKLNAEYYDVLAPNLATRLEAEQIGVDPASRRLRNYLSTITVDGMEVHDGAMRQRVPDGKRFIHTYLGDTAGGPYQSRQVSHMNDLLTHNKLLDDLQALVVDEVHFPDGPPLEDAVRELDSSFKPDVHGKNSTEYRIALRLVRYTRKRRRKEQERNHHDVGVLGVSNASCTAAALWREIADSTDELIYTAECFEPVFRSVVEQMFQDMPSDGISWAPMKDAVRAYEKAYDDYADRQYKPGAEANVTPIACVIDVLRCSFTAERVETLSQPMERVLRGQGIVVQMPKEGVTVLQPDGRERTCHAGRRYSVEVVRVKNKFRTPDSSNGRNLLVNLRISDTADSKISMFAEVQLKVASIYALQKQYNAHTHYVFFRGVFDGNEEQIDPLLSQLLGFFDASGRTPVLMSLMIAMRAAACTGTSSHGDIQVPENRNQLYMKAFKAVLHRWSGDTKLADNALELFGLIAEYNVMQQRNQREFTEREVREKVLDAATPGEEKEALVNSWDKLMRTDPDQIPLIKLLEATGSEEGAIFQFKHLSFQEVLAAVRIVSSASTSPKPSSFVPFKETYQELESRQMESVPFLRAVIARYFELGVLQIDPENVSKSCEALLPEKAGRRTYFQIGFRDLMLRLILTASKFPMGEGLLNLRGCAWVRNQEIVEWARPGSHVSKLDIRECFLLGSKGLKCLRSSCRNLEQLVFKIGDRTCKALTPRRGAELEVHGIRTITMKPFLENPKRGINFLAALGDRGSAIFPNVRMISFCGLLCSVKGEGTRHNNKRIGGVSVRRASAPGELILLVLQAFGIGL